MHFKRWCKKFDFNSNTDEDYLNLSRVDWLTKNMQKSCLLLREKSIPRVIICSFFFMMPSLEPRTTRLKSRFCNQMTYGKLANRNSMHIDADMLMHACLKACLNKITTLDCSTNPKWYMHINKNFNHTHGSI